MEQKILKRLEELTSEINDLYHHREDLIKNLKSTDLKLEGLSRAIFELKNLIEPTPED
jgi:peptidoglycan hydrolase CwlO-like protein